MKIPFLALIISIFISFGAVQAQNDIDPKVFRYRQFVWFGLDFSKARFVGSEGFTNPQDIKDSYLKKWNMLLLEEFYKYDFRQAYGIESQQIELSVAQRHNALVNIDEAFTEDRYTLRASEIAEVIQDYQTDNLNEGLGLVYIIESFDKNDEYGTMYVVFFDIATKQIFWNIKYAGTPGGYGMRNYWARSVLNVIRTSGTDFLELKRNQGKN